MGNKAAECSGPHACHDCHSCLGGDLCRGTTQDEIVLDTERTRLRCMLLDEGLTHDQIDQGNWRTGPTKLSIKQHCLPSCGGD